MRLEQYYKDKIEALETEIKALRCRDPLFLIGQLLTFLAFAGFGFAFFFTSFQTLWLVLSVVSLLAYLLVRTLDRRNSDKADALTCMQCVYKNEASYLGGDFSPFDDGADYADPAHPFTFDLDIFGRDSLFNRINRTVTSDGRERLARMLSTLPTDDRPSTLSEINERAEAINELAKHAEWMAGFLALGQNPAGGRKLLPSAEIKAAASEVAQTDLGGIAGSRLALVAAYVSVAAFVALILAAIFTPLSSTVPLTWACLQFVAALWLTAKPLQRADQTIGKLHPQFEAFVRLVEQIQNVQLQATTNTSIKNALFADDVNALAAFRKLSALLDSLTRRGNGLWMFLSNACALSDLFLLHRLNNWKSIYINKVYGWVDAVSLMDALVSAAMFRHNEPQTTTAKLVSSGDVIYEARNIYHPFVGRKAVKNDFSMADGNYYIITGANMAGKSTFLRSIGTNYILAMNGMPVFADSLRVSVFNLFTNMRTTDDLTHGISYFNAELLRLKQLLLNCQSTKLHSLIILDEILKGTNSLDKLNGSVYFLESIKSLPVTGVIATHDLELSKLSERYPDLFHNFCFEIELGSKITYTYKITPGVAKNQNATFLLKDIMSQVLGDGEGGHA